MVSLDAEGSSVVLAADYEEDLSTRWVPDVLGSFDFVDCFQEPSLTSDDVRFIDVPKAQGGWRTAPVLSAHAMRTMRNAVEKLRSESELILDPAVCGYRIGATTGSAYRDEYMRFRSIASALANEHRYVVTADVEDCFGAIDAEGIGPRMALSLGDAWEPVQEFLLQARRVGIRGLPAGYADARLIANHVLRAADCAIGKPFTRWVDDYRIFVGSENEAQRALDRLSSSLDDLGLRLNTSKSEVASAREYLTRKHGSPLESVYHPTAEPFRKVRANLRAIFLQAVSENNRRLLRFALPRLREQKDPIAVEYAIASISVNAIDTPRFVDYLNAFVANRELRADIQNIVANSDLSSWTITRLSPLLCRMPLDDRTFHWLREASRKSREPLVWSALLRILSVHGQKDAVVELLADGHCLDARTAIGASVDIGRAITPELRAEAPVTARAADQSIVVPPPSVYTLL